MKIVIGIMTEKLSDAAGWLTSYWNNVESMEHEIFLVIIDSNSSDKKRDETACRRLHADFLYATHANWRSLFHNYATLKQADLCVFFPSNCRIFTPGFFTRVVNFFQKNRDVGTLGFKAINGRGFNDGDGGWVENPKIIEEPVGPFAIEMETLNQLDYIDGNDWGVQVATVGRYSYSLPWPPVFNENPLSLPSVASKGPDRLVFWINKAGIECSVRI